MCVKGDQELVKERFWFIRNWKKKERKRDGMKVRLFFLMESRERKHMQPDINSTYHTY